MIAYLEGTVVSNESHGVVLDVGGVGYGVTTGASDAGLLASGTKVKLFIYEHIKEDAHDLYGFVSPASKQLFEQLLSVKNVGPRVAIAVMGIGNEETVRSAIAGGDVKLLQSAKGVVKRAAEQMVVELRDKVGLAASAEAEGIVTRGGVNLMDEAVMGLMALGYSEIDAQKALDKVSADLPAEQRIKQALKGKA